MRGKNQNTNKTHCIRGHEFTPDNTGRENGKRYCRTCRRAKWRNTTGKNKKYQKDRWLKWKYGISAEAFALLVDAQGNCCALCRQPFSSTPGLEPVMDHSHVTKKNRGVLHRKCNMALGLLGDDQAVCQLAAEYLRKHQDEDKD